MDKLFLLMLILKIEINILFFNHYKYEKFEFENLDVKFNKVLK